MEKRAFLLTGLPRFGSAWASCLLSHGDVYCAHELTGKCKDVDELADKLLNLPGRIVGNADVGALLILPELLQRIPNLQVVYVFRPLRASVESFAAVSKLDYDHVLFSFRLLQARLERLSREIPGVYLSSPELFGRYQAEYLWRHATGGVPLPVAHLEKMLTLCVQQQPELIQKAASSPVGNMLTARFNELLAAETNR